MHSPTATTLQHRSPIYCVTNANVVDCSIGAVVVLECRALLEYYFISSTITILEYCKSPFIIERGKFWAVKEPQATFGWSKGPLIYGMYIAKPNATQKLFFINKKRVKNLSELQQ